MQHAESTTIGRPAEDVWALIGDVRQWLVWIEDVSDVEVLSGELSPGSEVSYKWRGSEIHATISEYEPGHKIGITSTEDNYDFHESITLDSSDGGTGVTFVMGFDPTNWWMSALAVVLTPFKSIMLGRPLRKELELLRGAAEAMPTDTGQSV